MKIITSIFAKYPELFDGKIPLIYTDIPEGWVNFLEGFCDRIIRASSDLQISDFFFEKISCSQGFLDMEYSLPPGLLEDDALAINARAFAIRNLSYFGCVCCGTIIKGAPENGEVPLCERHLRSKIAANKSGKLGFLHISGLPQLGSTCDSDALAETKVDAIPKLPEIHLCKN